MLARNIIRVAAFRPVVVSSAIRTNVVSSFKKKEEASERDFINKTERQLLSNLLKKLAPVETTVSDKAALEAILSKNKVASSEGLVADLLAWKDTTH